MSSTDALGDAHATIGTMTSDQLLPNSTASFTCCLQLPVSKVMTKLCIKQYTSLHINHRDKPQTMGPILDAGDKTITRQFASGNGCSVTRPFAKPCEIS